MDIYDEILDTLKREYEAGATYEELAKRHGLSYPYLRALIQGIKPIERLSLEYLFKLFPKATIHLNGDTVNATNSGTINGDMVTGINKGTISAPSAEDFRNRAILATIDLDLPPDAIHTVQKMLKELKP